MGLDMYLEGNKYLGTNWDNPELNPREDGFEVRGRVLRLGYWRKHPDLHGYIVETFAEGVDECQEIALSVANLEQTLAASEADQLPPTTGFFFGESQPEDKDETRKILTDAIQWAKTEEKNVYRSVVYRASW